MAVLPDACLERQYSEAAARARRFLASLYPLKGCQPHDDDYPGGATTWREVWDVETESVTSGGQPLHILIAVPMTFPDVLPKAFLTRPVALADGRLPHLDRHRQLCTFDPTTSQGNADLPGEIALEVLLRAAAGYSAGVAGENADDFAEEVAAYWADDDGTASALSLVAPSGESRKISVLELRPTWRGIRWLFADKQADGERWLKAVAYGGKIFARTALYLPVADFGRPPYPSTNGELYQRLKASDASALSTLERFLQYDPRPSRILAAVPADTGEALLAWEHAAFKKTVMRPRGPSVVDGSLQGFRPHRMPPAVELSLLNASGRIIRASVADVSRGRVLRRAQGTDVPEPLQHPVNVIGCGSVGGFLADGLARCGFADRFRLVDSEVLSPENPQRHYCGMSEVGRLKSDAVARKIEAHYPHVRCEPHAADILDIVRRDAALLSPSSMTIVALGNFAAERRLNRLVHATESAVLSYPLCFVWAEPFLYGGHVLYLSHGSACFECLLDEDLRFARRVVADPSRFVAREAGCQSTYVPYGGSDLTAFTAAAVRFIVASRSQEDNLLLTWTGDLAGARGAGIGIRPEYSTSCSFGTHVHAISRADDCLVCAARTL